MGGLAAALQQALEHPGWPFSPPTPSASSSSALPATALPNIPNRHLTAFDTIGDAGAKTGDSAGEGDAHSAGESAGSGAYNAGAAAGKVGAAAFNAMKYAADGAQTTFDAMDKAASYAAGPARFGRDVLKRNKLLAV